MEGTEQIWKYRANGDIEGCPLLTDLNNDGFRDVIVVTENNSVYALNGKNGTVLWRYHDDIVSEYEASGFLASPACADMNEDGVEDIIIGSRNNVLYTFNGKTGAILWETGYTENDKYDEYDENNAALIQSGIHASAFIDNNVIVIAESYSSIHFFNFDGTYLKTITLENPKMGIEGLFASPVYYKDKIYIGTSWWGKDDSFWAVDSESRKFQNTGRVSSTCVISDVLGNGDMQVLCMTEAGDFLLLKEDGSLIERLKLPAGVEATPLIQDIDNDGKLEIIIACLNGFVYCYDTKSSGKLYYNQFRGNIYNTGRKNRYFPQL